MYTFPNVLLVFSQLLHKLHSSHIIHSLLLSPKEEMVSSYYLYNSIWHDRSWNLGAVLKIQEIWQRQHFTVFWKHKKKHLSIGISSAKQLALFIKAKQWTASLLLQQTWKIHVQEALSVKWRKKKKNQAIPASENLEAFPEVSEIKENFRAMKTSGIARQQKEGKELSHISLVSF